MNTKQGGTLSPWLAALCLWAGCTDEPASPTAPASPGDSLRVIPAGSKPSGPSGQKPQMVDMDIDELRLILVRPGSPAREAGFQPGDRILAGDGKDLASEEALEAALAKTDKGKKIFFEVRRGKQVLTLPLSTSRPGWQILTGDLFKGFLLSRAQKKPEIHKPMPGEKAPRIELPGYQREQVIVDPASGKACALLFWGTFLEPSYAHLQAFRKACESAGERIDCTSIDTMELFTAVQKTEPYARELDRVHAEIWSGPIGIDLFMASERMYGVQKLPTLVLLGKDGTVVERFDGPLAKPDEQIPAAFDKLTSAGR
ncbi:MAG: PDZ domain-containing protein [Deltaproteobacteria bacterium]|nr:PDZ domain-containing protein [Deltaproteobacteria bacterium]